MKCRNTNVSKTRKKQPPELFYKSRNICNIYWKSPVLEPLLNKVTGLQACSFINSRFSYEYCEILKTPILKIISVRLPLTRHMNNICFLFLEKCLLPKPNFPSFRFLYVLKRAFLYFFFTSMLY